MSDEQKARLAAQAREAAGMPPRPSVGRIVHYVAYGTPGGEFPKTSRAAVVTEVFSTDEPGLPASLCVLNPSGFFFNQKVPYDGSADPKGGTWHWPPRV